MLSIHLAVKGGCGVPLGTVASEAANPPLPEGREQVVLSEGTAAMGAHLVLFSHHGELDEERGVGEQHGLVAWSGCEAFPAQVCVCTPEQCLCLGVWGLALSREKAHGEVLEAVGDARLVGHDLSTASTQPCPRGLPGLALAPGSCWQPRQC